jgi:hypothetical protein
MGVAVTEEKVKENRLRRMAERRGFLLRKSRRRDRYALDYGYQLVDARTNSVVAANWVTERGYGLSLNEVEAWLDEHRKGGDTT